jgi:hypothetical protein
LPVSAATIAATSSASRSSSCAIRRRIAPRLAGVSRAQAGCAAAAAVTAASTSVLSDRATLVSNSPVAGAYLGIVSPDAAGRSEPPMTLPMVRVVVPALMP